MSTYAKADKDVHEQVVEVMRLYHDELTKQKVRVGVVMAYGPVDKDGGKTGPAIKDRGWPCLARIKINSLADRVEGKPDATLTLDDDGDRWGSMSAAEQNALIDHELEHLVLVEDKEMPGHWKRDDLGRPKLKIRPHDWEFNGFASVARRHEEASQEVIQAAVLRDMFGQLLWDFAGAEKPRKGNGKVRGKDLPGLRDTP